MKRWQFWLGLLISLIFLAWAMSGLNLPEVLRQMQGANLWWLIPGVGVYMVGLLIRAWRWHYLLRPIQAVPTKVVFPITAIGYMGNNIYPARIGELLRAFILKRNTGIAVSSSLATIIVERIFDGVVMLAFVIFNLPALAAVAGVESGFLGNIEQVALIGTGIFSLALVAFLVAALFPNLTRRSYAFFVDRFLPAALAERIHSIADKFLDGLASLRSPFNISMVFGTSVVIWLLETLKYWFVMHAFNFEVTFFALMLMNGIVNLATTIPSAPGYVGTFHAPGIAVLVAFGVDPNIAGAYTFVLHAALWLPVTLLGLYYFGRESLTWDQVREWQQQGVAAAAGAETTIPDPTPDAETAPTP